MLNCILTAVLLLPILLPGITYAEDLSQGQVQQPAPATDPNAAASNGIASAPSAMESAPAATPPDTAAAPVAAQPSTPDVPPSANPAASNPSSLGAVDNPAAGGGPGSAPEVAGGPAEDAEAPEAPGATAAQSAEAIERLQDKQAGIARLVKKLSPKGKTGTIVIIKPIDYTTLDFSELAQETINKTIQKYGKFNIKTKDYAMNALTLEEFRRIVARTTADVVIVTVLKPTNFDMFMYDRKNPYFIYAHSEELPEANTYKMTKDLVVDYMKVLIRRTLYSYLEDQYYELPRDETPAVMKTEIPRWIASNENLAIVNRDIVATHYISGSFGTALSLGGGGSWNSNLLSLQVGMKAWDNFYGELGFDAFAYNAFDAILKYAIISRETPIRFYFGGGLAYAFNQHTLNFDQNFTQGGSNIYIQGSGEVAFPIIDIYFKLEAKLLYGIQGGDMVFAVSPGLMLLF